MNMAYLSKATTEERRNGDGGLFSRMLNIEITFGAEEFPVDFNADKPDEKLLSALNKVADIVTLTLNVPPPIEDVPEACPEFQTADKLPPAPAPKPETKAPAATETKPSVPTETKPAPPANPCPNCGQQLGFKGYCHKCKTYPRGSR
jgi:hypothetical protein